MALSHTPAPQSVLELSDSQLERLAAARTQFLRQIADVCGERRAIFARLAQVEVPDSLRSLQHATSTWLKVRRVGGASCALLSAVSRRRQAHRLSRRVPLRPCPVPLLRPRPRRCTRPRLSWRPT